MSAVLDRSPTAQVDTGGVSHRLSPDQTKALDAIGDFLGGPAGKFSLVGPAGSGKTFVTAEVCRLSNQKAKTVHLTTPTHKACAVLRDATGKPVQTIHSLLRATLKTDYKTGVQYLTMGRKSDLKRFAGCLIVIDEASMVGESLQELVDYLVKYGAHVLFIGDAAQLNPVGELASICVDKERCPWAIAELTTIHRQAADNPIIAAATEIRETGGLTKFNALPDGSGVVALSNSEWLAKALENCGNLNEVNRVVSYTNASVDKANIAIRESVYGDDAKNPYIVGEKFICNSRAALEKEVVIENNTELTITRSMCLGDGRYQVECISDSGSYSFEAFGSYKERSAYLDGIAKTSRLTGNWREFYGESDKIPDLRHAFAMTGHKSQGSTFTDVFISLKELARCQDENEHRRLLYVAVTRATRCVYVCGVPS